MQLVMIFPNLLGCHVTPLVITCTFTFDAGGNAALALVIWIMETLESYVNQVWFHWKYMGLLWKCST
jgi:hypothetical protein